MVNQKYQLGNDMKHIHWIQFWKYSVEFPFVLKECKWVLVMYYIYTKIDQINAYGT